VSGGVFLTRLEKLNSRRVFCPVVFDFWMIFLYDLGVRCQDWRKIYMELILS
jgi:hypothetical protein